MYKRRLRISHETTANLPLDLLKIPPTNLQLDETNDSRLSLGKIRFPSQLNQQSQIMKPHHAFKYSFILKHVSPYKSLKHYHPVNSSISVSTTEPYQSKTLTLDESKIGVWYMLIINSKISRDFLNEIFDSVTSSYLWDFYNKESRDFACLYDILTQFQKLVIFEYIEPTLSVESFKSTNNKMVKMIINSDNFEKHNLLNIVNKTTKFLPNIKNNLTFQDISTILGGFHIINRIKLYEGNILFAYASISADFIQNGLLN